ncbi:STAS domain-containing protein [Urbifossiella limnaea]|uniref:STAS domain-containing protein n=1 Tax=Urbifossiella limnaea TaxID=2528023 RepID=A0A517XRI8_9BACT|nr:STAS domain-containing protein [Urbifossiella limnaea]QDU20093.1 hypothetical protein ETAA1_20360 [Urbifossiella limnaea]
MTDDLAWWLRYHHGVAVVSLTERDGSTELADDGLAKVIALERGRVVLELPPKVALPSWVLGKLILLHRRVQAARGTQFRLCCPEGPAREELRLTKLDRLIPTFETLDDAVRDF